MKDNNFLFQNISSRILSRIFESLHICLLESKKNENVDFYNEELIEKISKPYYDELKTEINTYKFNPHIREGFRAKEKEKIKSKQAHFPRITLLTIQSFVDAQKQGKSLIPSPLNILYRFLTVPDEPQSAAYALAACRSILFQDLKVHPEHPTLNKGNNFRGYKVISTFNIEYAVDSFRNYIKKRDNRPISERDDSQAHAVEFVGHFLALKGILYLNFSKKSKEKLIGNEENEKIKLKDVNEVYKKIEKFLQQGKISKSIKGNLEFRISRGYTDIPEASHLINQISGIPLPIRGADTVFMGGLQTTSQASLVISVSGNSGSGKTSFALDFASLLTPFKTICYYISFEEEKADLKKRLASITPGYLRKLSIFENEIDNWLYIDRQTRKFNIEDLTNYLEEIKKTIEKNKKSESTDFILPAICPLVIVIDSINGIIEDEKDHISYSDLEHFVTECRKLNAIIILLSAEQLPQKSSLNYLVDVEINLNLLNTDTLDSKPNRIFQLLKTRHQGSSFGAHLFHLSGKSGFRLSPQIPSQLDKREKVIQHLFDRKQFIHTLNILDFGLGKKDSVEKTPLYLQGKEQYLKIYPDSKIIIHGRGSSGKAGLALKILMSPPILSEEISSSVLRKTEFNKWRFERKILIISFLLSEKYYEPIINKIDGLFKNVYFGLKIGVETLSFYSGFLKPEDLISKITRKLDGAILEGIPYTGVLLDGLHNVFLQFPELQKRGSTWPMLYNLLSKFKVTVVTTFTNFSVELEQETKNLNVNTTYDPEKYEIIREGQTPFLHALVQASDFYILIEPHTINNIKKYQIKINGAPNQEVKDKSLAYNRESLTLNKWNTGELF